MTTTDTTGSKLSLNRELEGFRYLLRVFGCQMNEHDGERIAGMLEEMGAQRASLIEEADIAVFLTCCVREAADIRLLGQVASLKNTPSPHGHRLVAVGGCIGQRDGADLVKQLPHIDIVFGTHNLHELPELITEALSPHKGSLVHLLDEAEHFSTELPSRRENPWHAWVPIMTGCNNFCTYCIVPYVRGREKSRPIEDILVEIDTLCHDGVKEITLLGQNVNSYGRDLYGKPRFAEILHRAGETDIQRIRFATSHPKDLLDETIDAFIQVPQVMPQLHLPLQSGSDRVLSEMNRRYTSSDYLRIIDKIRSQDDGVAFSTDIIVGFPTETEEDFLKTLDVVDQVGYSQAFTFIYSKRDGTPAAEWENVSTHEEIQSRFDTLVEHVQDSAFRENAKDLDADTTVLFEGLSKRDKTMLSGRSPKNQTVHVTLPQDSSAEDFAGRILPVHIDETRTWYLRGHLL